MMKATRTLYALVISTLGLATACAQDVSDITYTTTDLGDGIYMLQGAGGNIGVSVGPDGVFVIDDDIQPMDEKLLAALADLSDQPVSYVINTHWHYDHTGGNAALGETGTVIMAHDNVRARMASAEGDRAAPAVALPVITFSDTQTLYFNGVEFHAAHLEHAHTDGDAVIHFRDQNLIHTGDVFFNGRYPFIDVNSGGSVAGYIAGQEAILAMTDDNTRIIPGHGPLATPDDLRASIAMLKSARESIGQMIADGKSLEEVKAANPLADFDADWSWRFINTDRMTEMLFNALQ